MKCSSIVITSCVDLSFITRVSEGIPGWPAPRRNIEFIPPEILYTITGEGAAAGTY